MKQSKLTGKFIFDRINKLKNEVNELGQACDTVSDEIGQGSLSYRLLNESYRAKQKELHEKEHETFIPEYQKEGSLF